MATATDGAARDIAVSLSGIESVQNNVIMSRWHQSFMNKRCALIRCGVWLFNVSTELQVIHSLKQAYHFAGDKPGHKQCASNQNQNHFKHG